MESGQAKDVSQQVENDTTPRTLDNLVSFKFSLEVIRDEDHIVDEDIEDVENQGSEIGKVQDSIAAERTRKIHVSLYGSLQI